MEKNTVKLLVLVGSIVAVLIVCIVAVGMVDGYWPWQTAGGEESTGVTTESSADATNTEESTTETTAETTGETTADTVEEGQGSGDPYIDYEDEDDLVIEVPVTTEDRTPTIGVDTEEDWTVESGADQGNGGSYNGEIDFDELLGKKE